MPFLEQGISESNNSYDVLETHMSCPEMNVYAGVLLAASEIQRLCTNPPDRAAEDVFPWKGR
jgi:hypothetical protein